jgi:hypothetical protein
VAVPVTARESVGSTARGPGPEHKGGFRHLVAHRQPFQPKVLVVDRTIGARREHILLRQFPMVPSGDRTSAGAGGIGWGLSLPAPVIPGFRRPDVVASDPRFASAKPAPGRRNCEPFSTLRPVFDAKPRGRAA